ncbi:MAG: class I SAM-dependent methyltransferase [Actinomycetota bacterium]|nr:class I SAM-dependent methyltransferase [Actinomycetota bacterium]
MKNEKPNFKFDAELYDEQINWEARFNVEKDFFYNIFKSNNSKRLLDIGCGTARHAQLFSSFVEEVYAMDPSQEMIDYARERVVKSENVKLLTGGFKDLANIKIGNFDTITCLGNTLPILENRRKVKSALKSIKKRLNKGGIAIFQFINFEQSMIEKNSYYQPKIIRRDDGRIYLLNRHFEYGKIKTRADFITTVLDSENDIEIFNVDTTMMCTLKIRIFQKMALNCGFKKIHYLGNDTKESFNKAKHISLFATLKT